RSWEVQYAAQIVDRSSLCAGPDKDNMRAITIMQMRRDSTEALHSPSFALCRTGLRHEDRNTLHLIHSSSMQRAPCRGEILFAEIDLRLKGLRRIAKHLDDTEVVRNLAPARIEAQRRAVQRGSDRKA